MMIRNRDDISTTALRRQALDMIEAGINRVLPTTLITSAVRYDAPQRILTVHDTSYDIFQGRMFVVGGGKAAGLMAVALESIVGADNITAGSVNCNSSDYETRTVQIVKASHPTPDERGRRGVEQMLSLKARHSVAKDDLVVCLLSGGGSALMPYPVHGVSLEDKQETTRLLMNSGADIREMNVVRKHLSRVKGGGLGHFFSTATVVSLIISDVVGNNPETIASGPTVPDSSTFSDACEVLGAYDLLSRVPESVAGFLERGRQGEEKETPKTLRNCHNYIIGDNMLALQAMSAKARAMGFTPCIVTAEQTGDTTAVARLRAEEIASGKYAGHDVILIGGETTPTLPTDAGKGGRNQHYAASSLLAMKKYAGEWVLASAGTDGSDFVPDVAGGIVDNNSLGIARASGVEVQSYLDRYDSNTLLRKLGNSLIVTGHTGTNVCDVVVYILK